MILVQLSDFVGQYQIARSNNIDPVLQSFIDREEKSTMYKLLGKELADLIITYLAANKIPAITRFDNILNPFYLQNTMGASYLYGKQKENQDPQFYESKGLKDLLINTIYYYYVTETSIMKSTQSGISEVKVDTSNSSTYANVFRYAEQKINKDGYNTWLAIWWRCLFLESSIYPEFLGTEPKIEYGSFF